jgi:tRNA (mo5U34)-methyltransferase
MNDPHLRRTIAELGPWLQNLHLPNGVQTAPDHPLGDFPNVKWRELAPALPRDLRGWKALDIGCNAGFYAFELARRGAQVLAIDIDPHSVAQARWARERLGLSEGVELRQMHTYELARLDDEFDLVLFLGELHRLRYPLLGLDIAARKALRLLVLQTVTMPGMEVLERTSDVPLSERSALCAPGWPKMAFVERSLAGDPTSWWVPNHACVEAMVRSCGLTVVGHPGHEFYLCEPAAEHPLQEVCDAELRAATHLPATTAPTAARRTKEASS